MKFKPFQLSDPQAQAGPVIDKESIVKAALLLLDEVGLEGLTMRSLAKKLGIKASSLYWHLQSKQDLLGLLAEEICAPMQEPDRSLPWTEQLDTLANEFRRVLLLHRDAAQVLASSGGPSGPKRLRLSELVLRILLDAGFKDKDAAYAGLLISDFVIMFVAGETQFANSEGNKADIDNSRVQNWIEALPRKDYPSLVSLAPYLAAPDADENFRFGIEILKIGLETHLVRH